MRAMNSGIVAFAMTMSVVLSGCIAYRKTELPVIEDSPAAPGRIAILMQRLPSGEYNWWRATRFAESLGQAGFRPSIVSDIKDVPADTPVVEEVEEDYKWASNSPLKKVPGQSSDMV